MILRRNLSCLSLLILFIVGLCNGELVKKNICNTEHKDDFDYSILGIVVSPLMTQSMIRELGIYWKNTNFEHGDILKLYENDPTTPESRELFAIAPEVAHGFKKTGISADYIVTSNLTVKEQCLKYHVSWIRSGTIKKTVCLSTHPNWMGEMKKELGHLKVREIYIPGTHDSAAYAKFPNFQHEIIVDKYTITQDEDVLGQLIYGARYLDIRVGRYPNNEITFWGNHGPVRIVPLQAVINAVKFFLDNTDEIVIFDVQEFPVGFKTMAAHYQLTDYLEREFAGYYLERPMEIWRVTLEEIWSTGKRLIMSYDYSSVVASRTSLWPQVEQQWGNVRTLNSLYRHLAKIETQAAEEIFQPDSRNRLSQPRAAMAQLTPSTFDVIFDRLGGLRKMAESVDINVTEWYSEEWQRTANVVAVDFIKATGIVEIAIRENEKRAAGC